VVRRLEDGGDDVGEPGLGPYLLIWAGLHAAPALLLIVLCLWLEVISNQTHNRRLHGSKDLGMVVAVSFSTEGDRLGWLWCLITSSIGGPFFR
jgi:hypothetical protein